MRCKWWKNILWVKSSVIYFWYYDYLHFVIDDGLDSDSSRSPSPTVRKKSQRSSLRSPEFVSKSNFIRNSMDTIRHVRRHSSERYVHERSPTTAPQVEVFNMMEDMNLEGMKVGVGQ